MTHRIYMDNTKQTVATVIITDIQCDEKGEYIIFDQTIFYPQGGGQPADQGWIQQDNQRGFICDVRMIAGEVRHYVSAADAGHIRPGAATVRIDEDRRQINTRYHTAGHLIAAIVESISTDIIATKGHQFPGEAYVQFDGIVIDPKEFVQKVQLIVEQAIVENKKVSTQASVVDGQVRECIIEGVSTVPCGGTHVAQLSEIGRINIRQCKIKKATSKISYEVIA